ncbi:unnamed protein product [Rotaria sp. Silwood2]|nr:unnamed protein product [Rotaria sp. Silwood2]
MDKEFQFVKDLALVNDYPLRFIECQIKKTLNRYLEKSNMLNNSNNSQTKSVDNSSKGPQILIDLPYIGKQTNNLSKQIIGLAKVTRPGLHIQPISRPPRSVTSFFPGNDKTPKDYQSNVSIHSNDAGNNNGVIGNRFRSYYRNLRKKQNLRYLQRIHEKSFGRATQSFFSNSSYENEIDYVVAGPNRYDEKSIDIDFLENHTYQEHDSCNNEDQIILENEMLQILYEEDSVDDDSYESEQDEHETLIDSENKKNKSFFIEIVKFIRQSNLNKTTTISLLSLLRSVHKLNIHDIPTATDALWKKLDISFNYESFFFCTNCFQQLTKFTDICFMCNNKRNVNSELCIFSLVNEIERVVAANIKLMEWYELPEHQTGADIINSPIYKQQRSFGTSQITLMLSTDGKNIIKSRQTQSSVWPIMSFIAEIPYPIREYYNNIILLGLWHSRVTPPASILLDKIVKNLKLLKATGNPVPSETPSDLPPIIYNGRNLLRDPLSPTPGCLMKKLINELFTKNEIMEDNHEQENERTTKIKDAIETAFFQGDKDKVEGFWEYEGKIIRGNQRRGLAHRKKLSLLSEQQIATFDEPTIKTVNNNENQ